MSYSIYHCTDNDFSLKQILFENRKVGDVGADCLLSVDGTDFRTRWINVNFWSYKFKKCGFVLHKDWLDLLAEWSVCTRYME